MSATAFAQELPCSPASDFVESLEGGPDPAFCETWNPNFAARGFRCCPKVMFPQKKRLRNRCIASHLKGSYCDEMTDEQREYEHLAETGKLPDVLESIGKDIGKRGAQAYCSVNSGFLAWGRPLLASSKNRVQLRSPNRCVNFGTDPMIGMLEWLGRQVGTQYADSVHQNVRLTIGDIAAPRGGCLKHRSHTSGQDADIGFLQARARAASPDEFAKTFDPDANWWLLKELFHNPYACVKVIFSDRKLIAKMAKKHSSDPDWLKYHRFIRHMKFHKNHFHVRVGDEPGEPGCSTHTNPDLEILDDDESAFGALDRGRERSLATGPDPKH